ncbi:hypothetical protein [Helicobacter sp. 13S00477-4]|uniref:hypothetical protein n=1 Tax=Helicobacter sp. 13S00477-4 TaxID=1905759 RepID=UPI000BA5B3A5|nr:hypothetical protein [Helicobacter sp. 13S00477-4]PAF50848.1 hypothetical protein BKH44_06785 [Helicobacter sp. 13S00477-4]
MTKREELLSLLSQSLGCVGFKSIDYSQRYTYDKEDLPVCIIKENSSEVNIPASGTWEYDCELSIFIISLSPEYDLAQEVFKIIKNLPKDTFIFCLRTTALESNFEDVPYHQLSLNFSVRYYCEEFSL